MTARDRIRIVEEMLTAVGNGESVTEIERWFNTATDPTPREEQDTANCSGNRLKNIFQEDSK